MARLEGNAILDDDGDYIGTLEYPEPFVRLYLSNEMLMSKQELLEFAEILKQVASKM